MEGLSAFTRQPLSCGIRASGRQQGEWATTYARTAQKCTSEERTAFQLGLAASILFKFSLHFAVKKLLSILMINWWRRI